MSLREVREVIAVDIGGSTTKLALVNCSGTVRRYASLRTEGPDAGLFLRQLGGKIDRLLEGEQTPAGIAVAVAGFAGADGSLAYNPNLPWLERAPIAAVLAARSGLPVHLEADANAACAGEYAFGKGRGAARFLCLVGGTGLGVGMVAGGALLRLAHGCMGDAGHVLVAPDGEPCGCGGRGCAEAYISTAALGRRYSRLLGRPAGYAALLKDRAGGSPKAMALLRESGHQLGIASASLANILFPDRIAVAGGLAYAGDPFFEAARSSFHLHAGAYARVKVLLEPAATRERATLLGAAACFFQPELRGG